MIRLGPQQVLARNCTVSEADSARVRKLIVRLGSVIAAQRALGISENTMSAARDCGRMQRVTRERLLAALEHAESTP